MKLQSILVAVMVLALTACSGEQPESAQTENAASQMTPQASAPEPTAPSAAPAEEVQAPAAEQPAGQGTVADTTEAAAEPIVLAQADTQAPAAPSGRFQMGKDYQRLTPTQPTSSSPEQVEVAEVFWYGCSHCYNFDPYVEKWLTRKPDNVNFVRIPAVWNPLVKFHARAFYTAQALDKEDAMHTAFFREIHLNQNTLDTEAKLTEFFGRFGVSSEDFSGAFNSFAVHTKLQQAETLARRYRVTSVPLVVVNGKYTTSASMAGGYDQLMEVIDELVVMEDNAT